MIKLTVLYPAPDEGEARFDHDYYRDNHVPLAVKTWAPARSEVDKGVAGPYVAGVHFYFADQAALDAAMGNPTTGEIIADVANYTDITPIMQTSEVVEPG